MTSLKTWYLKRQLSSWEKKVRISLQKKDKHLRKGLMNRLIQIVDVMEFEHIDANGKPRPVTKEMLPTLSTQELVDLATAVSDRLRIELGDL